jgi:uncharacterized membrane protein (UPF0136 family)
MHQRRKITAGLIILIAVVAGLLLKNLRVGLIAGLVLGLLAGGLLGNSNKSS